MNMYDDVTTMIELTQEELDNISGADGFGGFGLGGFGLGACGTCGFGLGACGTCGFSTGPFINAFTNSAVNKFAQSNSLATSNVITNSAFTLLN